MIFLVGINEYLEWVKPIHFFKAKILQMKNINFIYTYEYEQILRYMNAK